MKLPISGLLAQISDRQQGFEYDENQIYSDLSASSAALSNLGVKILSVLGGILGTGFFMGFIGALVWHSEAACTVLGLLLIAVALLTTKLSENTLGQTAILCAYVSGLVLLSIGVHNLGNNAIAIVLMLVSAASLFFASGFVLPFINTLVFNGALFALITINNAPLLIHVYYAYVVFIFLLLTHLEAGFVSAGLKINSLYPPIRSAFLFTLIGILITLSANWLWSITPYKWVSSATTLIAIVLVITYILNALKIQTVSLRVWLYLLSAMVLLPAVFAPAILGSLLILLLSYHYAHRTGFWTGLLVLVFSVSRYYYDLDLNLLQKSAIMLLSGVLFLIAFILLKKSLQHEN